MKCFSSMIQASTRTFTSLTNEECMPSPSMNCKGGVHPGGAVSVEALAKVIESATAKESLAKAIEDAVRSQSTPFTLTKFGVRLSVGPATISPIFPSWFTFSDSQSAVAVP